MWARKSCRVSAMGYFRGRKSVKGEDIVRFLSFSKLAYIADLYKEEVIIQLSLVKCLTWSTIKN